VSLGPPPAVTAVEPNVGSTGGGAWIRLVGAGLLPDATLRIGDQRTTGRADHRDPPGTILYVEVPAHAAGTVDVTVVNRHGQAFVLPAAYSYVPPDALDFDGTWSGFGNAGQDIPLGIRIEHGVVVAVSCDTVTVTLAHPPTVAHGEFSYAGADGVSVTGRIVSAAQAVGTMNLAPCGDTHWFAERQRSNAAAGR
jgi:hypothetical protein